MNKTRRGEKVNLERDGEAFNNPHSLPFRRSPRFSLRSSHSHSFHRYFLPSSLRSFFPSLQLSYHGQISRQPSTTSSSFVNSVMICFPKARKATMMITDTKS